MSKPTGTIHLVRACLEGRELTAREISLAIGKSVREVSNAIQSGRRHDQQPIYRVRKQGHDAVYSLVKPTVQPVSKPRTGIAPRYMPEFREMRARDFWISRDLAMITR